jgi:hypothetical protein
MQSKQEMGVFFSSELETTQVRKLSIKGGRTRTDKIGAGAGTDIVFPTSKTPVCRTHRPTKSLSAPARRSVSWVLQSSQHGSHVE